MNISIVGKNIKRIREAKGISAYKLAKLAHVGNTTISEIESGVRKNVKSDTLDKIAEALNVSSDNLLSLETNEEYTVQDIEDAFDFLLSSDELELKGNSLTVAEKDLLRIAIKEKIDEIIMLRDIFELRGIDASNAKDYNELWFLRNNALHGDKEK